MFSKFLIAFLPELLILMSVPLFPLINRYRTNKTPKTFFTLSKTVLVLALAIKIIGYKYTDIYHIFQMTPYTLLFKCLIYILAIAWFYLSLKWFLSKAVNSAGFYICGLLYVFCMSVAVSGSNLWVVFSGLLSAFWVQYFMIKHAVVNDEVGDFTQSFVIFGGIFSIFLIIGLSIMQHFAGSLNHKHLFEFLQMQETLSPWLITSLTLILSSFLYQMGIAPFHFTKIESISRTVLPVSGFLTIIPVFGYFACLVNLVVNVFWPVHSGLYLVFQVLSCICILWGAISVGSTQNLRRMFAYSSLYHTGVILLALGSFNYNGVLSSFIYLVIYTLATFGIYTTFYGFKNKGVYLSNVENIYGISATKPYISAAFLIFVLSYIGLPPLLGFLGRLSVVNSLIISQSYYALTFMLLSTLWLASAYLKVIKVVYFDSAANKFDRADKGIYICLFINMVMIIISIINPKYLMHDLSQILNSIF